MSSEPGDRADAADRLPRIADAVLAGFLDRDPVEATYLGDHRRDGLLLDPSAASAQHRAAEVRTRLAELDAAESAEPGGTPGAPPDDTVDAAVLRTVLASELLELDDVREDDWNPMRHNPGPGLHALLSREFAPAADRLPALAQRLAGVPDHLAAARERLQMMSAIHLDTALEQLEGTLGLIGDASALADTVGIRPGGFDTAAQAARTAVEQHRDWLRTQRTAAGHDPRLGADLFRAKLTVALDTGFTPERLLASAEQHLDTVQAMIEEAAARVAGVAVAGPDTVRAVLGRLAVDPVGGSVDDGTVLAHCADALAEATAHVRAREIVTVPDDFADAVRVVRMPEIDRGVAVAYCRPAGPLEPTPLPTEFAVSPTPSGWDAAQVRSFYREYNAHMLRNLTVHEAMPGHALQLMHANRHRERARTPVRAVWWNGAFVEGWAVYAEEVMADSGFGTALSDHVAAALRLQQLKMQLRTTINAILDIRYHCDALTEGEAMDLMQRRGFQESGEATGKWRRVQLSSTQLCMYYTGYREVRAVADDLRRTQPGWTTRQVHDAMLAHGSPPARHLRTLLELDLGLGTGDA